MASQRCDGWRHQSWLSPFVLAVVFFPAVMQSGSSWSCKGGDTTLAELAVLVDGENQVAFERLGRSYEFSVPSSASEAVLRAIPNDPGAQVWINVYSNSASTNAMAGVIGGGEATVPLEPGLNAIRVSVKAPRGASGLYEIRLHVEAGLATAAWRDSEVLAYPTDAWGFDDAAGHANGHAFVLWAELVGQDWELRTRRFSPDDGWQAPELVNRARFLQLDGHVAVGARGDAIAVWRNGSEVWARLYTPEEGWRAAELIEFETGWASSPQAVIDAQGNVLVVWVMQDACWLNRYTPDGGWENAAPLAQGWEPHLAGNDGGDALVVWAASEADSSSVWVRRYDPVAGWGEPQLLSGNQRELFAYSVNAAMGADGSAMVAWHQNEPTPDGSVRSRVWASRQSKGSAWEPPQLVESYELDSIGEEDAPAVAMDPQGNAFVAWMQWEEDRQPTYTQRRADVRANLYRTGLGWGDAAIVAPRSRFHWFSDPPAVRAVQLVVDDFGNALAVWEHDAPIGPGYYANRIWYNVFRPTMGWSEPRVVSEPGDFEQDFQYLPALIPDSPGAAKVFWVEQRGSAFSFRTSRFEPYSPP